LLNQAVQLEAAFRPAPTAKALTRNGCNGQRTRVVSVVHDLFVLAKMTIRRGYTVHHRAIA
jgi:hypothetical protein